MTLIANTPLDDRAAWGMAEVLARQALYRARALAHQEGQELRPAGSGL